MAVLLNRKAFEHAKTLVLEGKYVYDERDAWSDHQPSAEDENEFIHQHGFGEYANRNISPMIGKRPSSVA
jgi:hypothetical protein